MNGRRIYPTLPVKPSEIAVGDYFKGEDGTWSGIAPNGLWVWLNNHAVTEHEDGTITVSPSILSHTTRGKLPWHGHLKLGVWEEC